MSAKCEYANCRSEPVQDVRRLWDGVLIHFCEKHAMKGADAAGLIHNRFGLPACYRVENDARVEA